MKLFGVHVQAPSRGSSDTHRATEGLELVEAQGVWEAGAGNFHRGAAQELPGKWGGEGKALRGGDWGGEESEGEAGRGGERTPASATAGAAVGTDGEIKFDGVGGGGGGGGGRRRGEVSWS